MPSWNIHTAHVEGLLATEGAAALGVRDTNQFLMGNVLPDICVGYMVPNPSVRIDYKLTHLAVREHIPLPRHDLFWDFYIRGMGEVSDLVLGTWTHLVADHVYNQHTRCFLSEKGIAPGEAMRIAKQADFALFGRTLRISSVPEVNDALLTAAAAFPQYSLAAADVRAAAEVAAQIVADNCAHQVDDPAYHLLTPEFFAAARSEAHEQMVTGLKRYVAGLA